MPWEETNAMLANVMTCIRAAGKYYNPMESLPRGLQNLTDGVRSIHLECVLALLGAEVEEITLCDCQNYNRFSDI